MKNEWRVDLSRDNRQLTRYYHSAPEAATEAVEHEKHGWIVGSIEEVVTFFPESDLYGYELRVTNDGKTWTTEAKFKNFDDAMFCLTEKNRIDHREMKIFKRG